MMLATLLFMSIMFLICLLKPIKNPVLNKIYSYAASVRIFPMEYMIANFAGFPVATLRNAPKESISRIKPR